MKVEIVKVFLRRKSVPVRTQIDNDFLFRLSSTPTSGMFVPQPVSCSVCFCLEPSQISSPNTLTIFHALKYKDLSNSSSSVYSDTSPEISLPTFLQLSLPLFHLDGNLPNDCPYFSVTSNLIFLLLSTCFSHLVSFSRIFLLERSYYLSKSAYKK